MLIKIRVGGHQRTEKCALESVLICRFSETPGASHADRGSAYILGRHRQVKRALFKLKKPYVVSQEKNVPITTGELLQIV